MYMYLHIDQTLSCVSNILAFCTYFVIFSWFWSSFLLLLFQRHPQWSPIQSSIFPDALWMPLLFFSSYLFIPPAPFPPPSDQDGLYLHILNSLLLGHPKKNPKPNKRNKAPSFYFSSFFSFFQNFLCCSLTLTDFTFKATNHHLHRK